MSTEPQRVVIVGGGLVGALNACFFAKKGWHVDLYEFREDIRNMEHVPGRSINLALSYRGRQALAAVGLEDYIVSQGVPMHARLVHDKTGQIGAKLPYGKPGQYILSTNRRELNEVMLTQAEHNPNVRIFFQHKLKFCKLNTKELVFQRLTDGQMVTASADLICACDGAYSALRQSLMKVPGFNYSQEYIPHGYMELCILPSTDNKFKMPPNYFHLWPRGNFVLIALANRDKTFTVTLFAPMALFESLKTERSVLSFFEENFPDALSMIGRDETVERFLKVRYSHLVSIKVIYIKKLFRLFFLTCERMLNFFVLTAPFWRKYCTIGRCCSCNGSVLWTRDELPQALKEYSSLRCVDAHTINDLAMYNYSELRDLVNQKGFRWRKNLDYFLNKLFPSSWIPLYSMVTFSRIRYHDVMEQRKKQDRIVSFVGYSFVAGVSALGVFAVWKILLNNKNTRPIFSESWNMFEKFLNI